MSVAVDVALVAMPAAGGALLIAGIATTPDTPARRARSWLLLGAGMGTILCFASLALLPLLA